MGVIKIDIPDIILQQYKNRSEIKRAVIQSLVIDEFRKGNLTIGQAAELLGLTYVEFMMFLGERGISFCNLSKEELEEDRATLERLLADRKK